MIDVLFTAEAYGPPLEEITRLIRASEGDEEVRKATAEEKFGHLKPFVLLDSYKNEMKLQLTGSATNPYVHMGAMGKGESIKSCAAHVVHTGTWAYLDPRSSSLGQPHPSGTPPGGLNSAASSQRP
ncbi:hypothetical protein MNEG_3701 [Monoraphidium neglectum]|uniref:Uncharacterized protein n=1 Tax=Monoraphidium neglectum TaxID=145388 RepID=A0A0D2MUS4_9CHLO|nr:hypothetical protein MNEG_3701 [Monoraphidium neglectum]KIZ04262.1 hypothetical protein MNEG_3701 [Monoraphidium neglectum]|eukprot:XP_013903281.1 hypothetical protein MNEG_3701 [Monoraphidium neglectum]